MPNSVQPVLVGAGQMIDRPSDLSNAQSPLALMRATAQACAIDAGLKPNCLQDLDVVAVVNSVGPALLSNPPGELAKTIGARHAQCYLSVTGGNTPQMLVNRFATEIAQERVSMVLLSGAEALHSLAQANKAGVALDWEEDSDNIGTPTLLSKEREGTNETEKAHGMMAPIATYPLFENAIRHHSGASLQDHQLSIGKLFAPFTTVARDNPCSWFPIERSAEEIARPSADNRYIGFPYTKYMNAVMQVNQSASLLLMSDVKAQSLGIDESRWIYLHGHCEVNDIWHVSERTNFHSSPALQAGITSVLEMAKVSANEINHFDIYSCFPAVVEMTRDALGMNMDDPRLLTVTGGLPYFGGAGNNYTMHGIATMLARLRQAPGDFGLVTANGWYLTKHALGIYSSTRPQGAFRQQADGVLTQKIQAAEHPSMNPMPTGSGTVETFTVMFNRSGEPETGLVIGRLDDGGRFVAHTPADKALLEQMTREDPIGQSGTVISGKPTNLFEFD